MDHAQVPEDELRLVWATYHLVNFEYVVHSRQRSVSFNIKRPLHL